MAAIDHSHRSEGPFPARQSLWDWDSRTTTRVLNPDGSVRRVLDEWQTMAFQMADGSHTIEQALATLRRQWANPADVPATLDAAVTAGFAMLIDELGVVTLRDRADDLPYYSRLPFAEQTPDKTARSLRGEWPEDDP